MFGVALPHDDAEMTAEEAPPSILLGETAGRSHR